MNIVFREGTPVGCNDRRAGQHGFNLDAAERLDKGRGKNHGFGLPHELFPGLHIGDADMLDVFRDRTAGAGAEPLETARARNDQLTADRLDDLHCNVHALSRADAAQIHKIVFLVGRVFELPEVEIIWDHRVVPYRVAHLGDRFQTEISM